MTQPTVALLGTGTMGAGMARNIAAARIPLTVWNRTRSRAEPLAEAGIEVADSPADAVRDADLVVTMLFDVESVESALDEARDGLKQGAVLVQQSTVGVAGADALAARAAELGLVYVDAPVLGTKKPAEDGALVILASGPDEVRDTVAPLFDAIGSRTVWVGEAGQGTRLKLVAELLGAHGRRGHRRVAHPGQGPRHRSPSVPRRRQGRRDGRAVRPVEGRRHARRRLRPVLRARRRRQDAALIVEAARGAGADLAVIEAVQQHFARALDAGHGDQDMAATVPRALTPTSVEALRSAGGASLGTTAGVREATGWSSLSTPPDASGRRPGWSSLSRPLDWRAGGGRVVEPVETTRLACGRRPGGRACRDHSTGVREATGWSSLSRPPHAPGERPGGRACRDHCDGRAGGDRVVELVESHSTGVREATRVVEPVETTQPAVQARTRNPLVDNAILAGRCPENCRWSGLDFFYDQHPARHRGRTRRA